MKKELADKTITQYMKKIYGFALTKTKTIDLAEELAAKITFEVYKALLKSDAILNINSYIYRISSNVYSRFLIEEMDGSMPPEQINYSHEDNYSEESDVYERLRNEISYLSNVQREIIYLHYFEKMKLHEIALKVSLPHSTVRWHLFDARNQLKEGFKEHKTKRNTNKILFKNMMEKGILGPEQTGMSFYFSKKLTHSIAYSAYYLPKTSIEIAKELTVPVAFIEDEISFLIENGFMKKAPGKKYQTNIYLIKNLKDISNKTDEILNKYAQKICEQYIPVLVKSLKKMVKEQWKNIDNKKSLSVFHIPDSLKIYSPQKDFNFLLWSMVTFACGGFHSFNKANEGMSKYAVKRKDGGEYIATAHIEDNPLEQGEQYKNTFDRFQKIIFKDIHQINTWQFFSKYDDRNEKFSFSDNMIFENLYDFIIGKISKEPANIDKYVNLIDKGYIVSDKKMDLVNLVIASMSENAMMSFLAPFPKELLAIGNDFDNEMYEANKKFFPPQMQDLCRLMNQNSLMSGQTRVHIINNLLENKILKPLKKNQKSTVNMVLFL